MRCRSVLTRIDAMRTGELPNDESSAVNEHLKTCRSCGESVHDLGELVRDIKSCTTAPPQSLRSLCYDSFDVIERAGEKVFVAFTDRGLRMIQLAASEHDFRETYLDRFGRELTRAALPERLRKQVVAALSGEGVHDPKVDLSELGEFERTVLEILTKIPAGEVRTYSWVAQQAGRPKAVRAVGNICARNVVPFVVPCHRVVPSSGGVGNYAFGSPRKRELLRREGVPVDELDDLARRGVRYVGSKTTKVFCCPTCRGARRIRDENRVTFHDEDEAMKKGFRPCKVCQPVAA